MSQINSQVTALDAKEVFNQPTAEARNAYMRRMGATNIKPPLPRSSHLRNKATGRVMPWNELLAGQQDLMECCPASGNTNPEAWMPTVQEEKPGGAQVEAAVAQAEMMRDVMARESTARAMTSGYVQPHTPVEPQPMEMPNGAVPFQDIDKMDKASFDALIDMVNA